jgi:hypothetical protein
MDLFTLIVIAATLFMLACVVGLTIQLNRLTWRLRKQEDETTFYRSWAFRLALARVEDAFAEEPR